MNFIDEKLVKAQSAVQAKLSKVDPVKLQKRKNMLRTGIIIASVATVFIAMACGVFAANDTIDGMIKNGLGEVYSIITAIVIPIAVIAAAVGAIMFFFGGEKGMQNAKRIWFYTAIGIAGVYLAPLIMNTVADWFKGSGTQGVFN